MLISWGDLGGKGLFSSSSSLDLTNSVLDVSSSFFSDSFSSDKEVRNKMSSVIQVSLTPG